MASGLLDRLTFKTEPDSEPDSETSMFSDSDSELDSEYILAPDPAPQRTGKPSRGRESATPPKVTAAARKEVRETIEALVELPIDLWKRRDPHCAGVAEEQHDDIIDAFVAFVCKRPAWMAALTDLGMSSDWLKMVKACYPLVMAIVAHHVTRTVGDQQPGGDDDLSAYQAPRLAV
jgi:hypothetical protein